MKKTLFYLFLILQSTLLICGVAFAEDWQLRSHFRKQNISETRDFQPIEGKGANLAISIHHTSPANHTGNNFISLDLGRLKREAEMEVFCKNAYENPSPNVITVFKMVFDEFTYFKELKRFLDGVEMKVENYRRKYKLKGEIGFTEQFHTEHSDSTGPDSEETLRGTSESENIFSNLLPERISWHFSTDLESNYLKGELELGNHFIIEGNWGSDSNVKAMVTFPF